MTQSKQQLEMVRSSGTQPAIPALPSGYLLRQYKEPDRASYWRLFAEVFKTRNRLDDLRSASLPGGFHVIEDTASGDVVASAVAAEYPRAGHLEPGSLQWVMTDPLQTGKGLGKAVVAAATGTLAARGYRRVYLSTDDWRLPAIHVYLELGWKPLLHTPDMKDRWMAVYERLKRAPEPDEFVAVP